MTWRQYPFEVKFAADGPADGTFSGYGAVFNNTDDYGDVLVKGAFKDTIAAATKTGVWPVMLVSHGPFFGGDPMPIGIWTALEEDAKGLRVEGKLALETQRGKETYALLQMQPRPAITGLSIGFRAKQFVVGTKQGEPRRTLQKVDLFEISLVTSPANDLARIDGLKSMPTEREFEELLVRDAGFSSREAKTIIASGFKSLKGARDAAGSDHDGAVEAALERLEQLLRA